MSYRRPFLATASVLALSVVTVAMIRQAQAQLPATPVVGAGGQVITTYQPGTYVNEQYSKTQLHQDFLKSLEGKNKAAYDYYMNAVQSFERALNEFQSFAQQSMILPAQKSLAVDNSIIPVAKYLDLVSDYAQRKSQVEIRIQTLTSLPEGLAGVVDVKVEGSGISDIPTLTNGMKFDALKADLEARLAAIEAQVRSTQARVSLPKAQTFKSVSLLDTSFIKDEFSLGDLMAQLQQAQENAIIDYDDSTVAGNYMGGRPIITYTHEVMDQVGKYFNEYGIKEAHRWNVHDKEFKERRARETQQIVDYLWQRSYLRMRYGINLGAFSVNYKTMKFGADRLFTNLKRIEFTPATTDSGEIMGMTRELAEALKTAGSKGKSFSDILAGKVGLIPAANSIVSMILGQDQVAQAMETMFALVARDLYEERMVADGKRNELIADYRQRFYADEVLSQENNPKGYTQRQQTLIREMQFDYDKVRITKLMATKDKAGRPFLPEAVPAPGPINKESMLGKARLAADVLKFYEVAFAKANAIRNQIDAYRAAVAEESGADVTTDLLDQ